MHLRWIGIASVLAATSACGSSGGSAKVTAKAGASAKGAPPPAVVSQPARIVMGTCKSKGQAYADKAGWPVLAGEQAELRPAPPRKSTKPAPGARRKPPGAGAPAAPMRLRMPPPPRNRVIVRVGRIRTAVSINQARLRMYLRPAARRIGYCLRTAHSQRTRLIKTVLQLDPGTSRLKVAMVMGTSRRAESCIRHALGRTRTTGVSNQKARIMVAFDVSQPGSSPPSLAPVPPPPPPPNIQPNPDHTGDMEEPAPDRARQLVPPALLAKYARDVVREELKNKVSLLRTCFPPAAFERVESPAVMRVSLTINKQATVVSSYATGTQQYNMRQCVSTTMRGITFSKQPPASIRVSCELTVHAPGGKR